MPRDNFTPRIKRVLAERAAHRCANPDCGKLTVTLHSAEDQRVLLGLACHITAASPGGPRFDPTLSTAERRSIRNAVWLCIGCGTLVDRDESRFTAEQLRAWKLGVEARTARDSETSVGRFYPQPTSARHAPIPVIRGLGYDAARELLIGAGWQPRMHREDYAAHPNFRAGNGQHFVARGYMEIINAWPTGLAQCTFGYFDAYGEGLVVVTLGEAGDGLGDAYVRSWHVTKDFDDLD